MNMGQLDTVRANSLYCESYQAAACHLSPVGVAENLGQDYNELRIAQRKTGESKEQSSGDIQNKYRHAKIKYQRSYHWAAAPLAWAASPSHAPDVASHRQHGGHRRHRSAFRFLWCLPSATTSLPYQQARTHPHCR